MQMIDVLKRLAELDAVTPAVDTKVSVVKQEQAIVVKEDAVAECGIMPEMGMMGMPPEKPSTPATINMTAGSGQELSDMLTTIMTLAGQKQHGAEPHGEMPPPAVATTGNDADSMRSVIDKLNPADDEEGEQDQDDQEETDEGTLGQLAGGALGAAMGGPAGAAIGAVAGDALGDMPGKAVDSLGKAMHADENWDNTPNDPKDKNEFDANEFANQENQPGAGDTEKGKARSRFQPATFESLMKEYKAFIGESAEEEMDEAAEEDLEEGTCSSCHKDPCECESTEESTSESLDILKLAGLK